MRGWGESREMIDDVRKEMGGSSCLKMKCEFNFLNFWSYGVGFRVFF